MACAMTVRSGVAVSSAGNGGFLEPKRGCSSVVSLHLVDQKLKAVASLTSDLKGEQLLVPDMKISSNLSGRISTWTPVHAQASISVSKAPRWWEKSTKPNMVEIRSAQQLVTELKNAGDRLVIVDFYSPGCGGCRALHPKICQLAEANPNAVLLIVNYEELKTMSEALHIHVLPFFRFYRGAEGKVCSFSCTNATIKKFKDALSNYGADGSSFGPAKGLDDSELLELASIGEISLDSVPSKNEENISNLFDLSRVWAESGLIVDGSTAAV